MIPSFTSLKTVYQGPKNINDWTFYDPSSGQIFSKLGENPKTQEIETKKKQINLAHGTWKLNNGSFETRFISKVLVSTIEISGRYSAAI